MIYIGTCGEEVNLLKICIGRNMSKRKVKQTLNKLENDARYSKQNSFLKEIKFYIGVH